MKHKQKVKLAKSLSGRTSRHFESDEWLERKEQIKARVLRREQWARENSLQRAIAI